MNSPQHTLESFDERYEVEAELAHGGMGRVVIALDRKIGREVAIKELLDPRSAEAVARFEREALMTARLQHPAIISVYDVERRDSGELYLVMRRIHGKPLSEWIASARQLDERLRLLPNLLAAVDAVAYAHGRHVIHRDLKPGNVLVGDFGETVVIDWGLAKDLSASAVAEPDSDRGLTQQGTVLGTPSYMAPEQARGEPADERTDVYTLGAVLYELIAGEPPFEGETTGEVLLQVMNREPRPLEERFPELPRDLVSVVRKAMAKSAAQRFPTARELSMELRNFQSGRLLSSHEYSTRELLARWVRKHRTILAVAAVSFIALVATAGASYRRVVAERERARSGQRAAEAATQQLTLERARSLADRDPTAALETLATLMPEQPVWAEARLLAQHAEAMNSAQVVLRGYAQTVGIIRFNEQGELVTFGDDRTMIAWDLERGVARKLFETPEPLEWFTHGRFVETQTADLALHAFDLTTGKESVVPFRERMRSFAAFPNGAIAGLTLGDRAVFLDPVSRAWRVIQAGDFTYFLIHTGNPAEPIVASAVRGSPVSFWSPKRGVLDSIPRTFNEWSPDGKVIARIVSDGTIVVHDIETHKDRSLTFGGNSHSDMAISMNGLLAATVAAHVVELHDLRSGTKRELIAGGAIDGLAFYNDGRFLTASLGRGAWQVWDLQTGRSERYRQNAAARWWGDVAVTDKWFAVTDGPLIRVFSASRQRASEYHAAPFENIQVAADGRTFFTFAQANRRHWVIHDVVDGTSRAVPDLDKDIERVWTATEGQMTRSAVGALLSDGSLAVLQATATRWTLLSGPKGKISHLASNEDGSAVAAAVDDSGEIWTWNLPTTSGRPLAALRAREIDRLQYCAGNLVANTKDGRFRLVKPDGRVQILEGIPDRPTDFQCSGDGRWLAFADSPNLKIVDTQTGAQRTMGAGGRKITSWAISRDGSNVLLGTSDGAILLWSTAPSTSPRVLSDSGLMVSELQFAPSGDRFLSTVRGVLHLWDIASGRSVEVGKANFGNFAPDGQAIWGVENASGGLTADQRTGPPSWWRQVLHRWPDDYPTDPAAVRTRILGAIRTITLDDRADGPRAKAK